MTEERVDVVIVGAGASGAALAWSLADSRMRIVCLEQGGVTRPQDHPTNFNDWEVRSIVDRSANPNMRLAPADYPVDDTETPIKPAMFNGVGGGTILWAGHFPRMRPADFKRRTNEGLGEDWPIDYATLEPFFAKNDEMMGVSGLAGDPAYPPKEVQLPPIPLGKLGHTLARGFDALGWHWWPADSAIASQPYEGRDKCVNLGPCTSGCAQGAKASTDVTYWPEAQRKGVELRTGCRVRDITLRDDGMADGVRYHDADGTLHELKAEVVILCCNGVGTPRLLLNSKSERFPDGLANRSGLVGKNLMLHPYGVTTGVFDEVLDSYMGPVGCSLWSHQFVEHDPSRGFERGYTFETLRGFGPATTALSNMRNGQIPWGEGHHAALSRIFNHTAALSTIVEDLPEEHNCVTLNPSLADSNGIPAPKMTYRMSENSRLMLAHGAARAEEVLLAAGAKEVFSEGPWELAGWHLLGTARMGDDPKTSVANAWGRSHDVRNLFIADASLFVTSGAVNPTSTIQALALYIADRIKKNLETLFD